MSTVEFELDNLRNLILSDRFISERIIVVETNLSDVQIERFMKGSLKVRYYRHIHNSYDGNTIVDSLMSQLCQWLPPTVLNDLELKLISSNSGLHPGMYRSLCSQVFRNGNERTLIHLRREDGRRLGKQELDFFKGLLSSFKDKCSIFVCDFDCKWCEVKKEYFQNETTNKKQIFMDKVYFSHKQKVNESDTIIDLLIRELKKRDVPYSIDLEDLNLQNSIQEYGDEIGKGKWIVVILVEGYLRSLACMYEMAQIFENGYAGERIFSIVDRDGVKWDSDKLKEIKNYWEDRQLSAAADISPSPSEHAFMNARKINIILKHLDDLWMLVNDRISQDVNGYTEETAKSLVDDICKKMVIEQSHEMVRQLPDLQTNNLRDIAGNTVTQVGGKNVNINGSVYGDINL